MGWRKKKGAEFWSPTVRDEQIIRKLEKSRVRNVILLSTYMGTNLKITILKEVEVRGMQERDKNCYFNCVHEGSLYNKYFQRQQYPFFKCHFMLVQWMVCTWLHLVQTHPVWPTAPLRSPG